MSAEPRRALYPQPLPILSNAGADAIRAAATSAAGRSMEAAGFLIGSLDKGQILADGCEWIESERLATTGQLRPAELDRLDGRAQIVGTERPIAGVFRSLLEEGTGDHAPDAQLGSRFPGCRLLVIAVPRPDGRCTLRIYHREGKGEWVRERLSPRLEPAAVPVRTPEQGQAAGRRWPVAGNWVLGAVGCAVLAALVWMGRPAVRPAPAPAVSDVALRVEVAGPALRLTWNRDSAAVRGATSGLLKIDDGPRHRDVAMSGAEVAAGSILYRPGSDDTVFRFEVTAAGRTVVETARVLDALKSVGPADQAVVSGTRVIPAAQQMAARAPAAEESTSGGNAEPAAAPARSFVLAPAEARKPAEPVSLPAPPEIASLPVRAAQIPVAEPKVSPPSSLEMQTPVRSVVRPPAAEPEPVGPSAPPRALKQVMPSTRAFGTSLVGEERMEVEVLVDIDVRGRITGARITKGGTAAVPQLQRNILLAARQWEFSPALVRGRAVPSQHSIVFRFGGR